MALGNNVPPAVGTGSKGSSSAAARSDHTHSGVRTIYKVGTAITSTGRGDIAIEPGAACTLVEGTDTVNGVANHKLTFNCTASGGTSHNILSATHTDTSGAGAEAQGDIIYRNGSGAWTRLPIGSSSQVLKGGTVPAYGSVATSELSGAVSIAQGGTGVAAAGDDQVLVGNGTTFVATTMPQCNTPGSSLFYDQSTNAFTCYTPAKPLPKVALGLPKPPCNAVRRTNCQ